MITMDDILCPFCNSQMERSGGLAICLSCEYGIELEKAIRAQVSSAAVREITQQFHIREEQAQFILSRVTAAQRASLPRELDSHTMDRIWAALDKINSYQEMTEEDQMEWIDLVEEMAEVMDTDVRSLMLAIKSGAPIPGCFCTDRACESDDRGMTEFRIKEVIRAEFTRFRESS